MMRLSVRSVVTRLSQQCRAISGFTQADLPKFDFVPDKYDGPSPDQLLAWRRAHINPAIYMYYKQPLTITQGKMQYLYDEKGQRYIDSLGGIVTISCGHCHPKIVAALNKQMNRLWHCTTIYNHPPLAEYAEKITSKFPEPLKVAYFVNSGSEANDLALMLARLHTGCQDIISLRYAYHGISPYVQATSALSTWRHSIVLSPGHHHVVTPDPYHGVWGGKNCRNSVSQVINRDCDCKPGECKACDLYVNDVDDIIKATCTKTKLGGFICESIMGASGTIQFPRDYLRRAYKLIREKNGVCIADEVQTGWGRCGEAYWGFQTHGVMPDIVTMAKGIGNGFPLAAVVTTPEIAATLTRANHFNTFGGNPLACAVGSAVIDVIDEEKLQENSKMVGTYMLKKMMGLQKRHPVIGDVRGLGLMQAIEFVADPEKKTPLQPEKMNELMELMMERFVIVGKSGLNGNVFRFKPPMCITKADIDYLAGALHDSLKVMGL